MLSVAQFMPIHNSTSYTIVLTQIDSHNVPILSFACQGEEEKSREVTRMGSTSFVINKHMTLSHKASLNAR